MRIVEIKSWGDCTTIAQLEREREREKKESETGVCSAARKKQRGLPFNAYGGPQVPLPSLPLTVLLPLLRRPPRCNHPDGERGPGLWCGAHGGFFFNGMKSPFLSFFFVNLFICLVLFSLLFFFCYNHSNYNLVQRCE